MERHIGVWHIEGKNDKAEVGELIIEGNQIEFYSRFSGLLGSKTFVGNDSKYKVFVKGNNRFYKNNVVDNVLPHRVDYVLNGEVDLSQLSDFSFIIPELIDWFGIETVSYGIKDKKIAAVENRIPPVLLSEKNPKIEICFESKTIEKNGFKKDNETATEKTICQKPVICVSYNKPVELHVIISEIECLMQFFGLLIGRVSKAEDIILNKKCGLYINRDFSYNLLNLDIFNTPRTYYYVVEDKIQSYYSKWRKFFKNDDFSLLRRVYFSVNDKKEKIDEEVFVEYMRFLDGYHTRISDDDDTKKNLNKALIKVTKVIRSKIFDDEGRPLFEDAIHEVLPDWKYNKDNAKEIAKTIARNYVERKKLSQKVEELDKKHFNIISQNAIDIEKLPLKNYDYNKKIKVHIKGKYGYETDEEVEEKFNESTQKEKDNYLIEIYYKELGDTRNYYSHYKKDKTGVLEFVQLSESINVLKATIISILLSHIGIRKEIRRKMLAFDSELFLKTDFLRKKDEKPFISPKNYYKMEQDRTKE